MIDKSYAHYGDNNNNSSNKDDQPVETFDYEDKFDNIRDGGYHEGYWKARYSANKKGGL